MKSTIAWPLKRLLFKSIILLFLCLVVSGFPKESKQESSKTLRNKISSPEKSKSNAVSDSSVSFRSFQPPNIPDSTMASKRWLSKLSSLSPQKQARPKNARMIASEAINAFSVELTECYHSYLKLNPDLHGTVTVRILVNDRGSVYDVEVLNSAIKEAQFQKEILSIIKSWDQLPPAEPNTLSAYRQEFVFGEE